MAQGALAHAVNPHDQAAGWVGASDAAVGFHPVRGVIEPLFCRQKRYGGMEGVEAKVFAVRQRNLTATHVKAVTHGHIAGAITFNALDHDG